MAVSTLILLTGCAGTSFPTIYVFGTRAVAKNVCIELNPAVYDGRFLPALQTALQKQGVQSAIYNRGATPGTCETRIIYNVVASYGNQASGNNLQQFWSVVDLDVLQHNQIVVSAHYESHEMNNRWLEMRKLSEMVGRLISISGG